MSLLKRLFSKSSAKPASVPFNAPITPDAAFFAIGDIHGCHAKMTDLLAQCQTQDVAAQRVFVGDYVDRGEDSAAVLRDLFAMRNTPGIICLAGNHEDMMLNFIADPAANGPRWLRYGGLQTLASFGVGGVTPNTTGAALVTAAAAVEAAMGPDLLDWLRHLPTSWQSGNVAVVHAGADPALPIAGQSDQILKWGHADFDHVNRTDDIWVVHGHTIVDQPRAAEGRIATDTGAYATGRLTAAYITAGDVRFVQV